MGETFTGTGKVRSRLRSAAVRIANIAKTKPPLGTDDPLMAEIQLAQLDALLAIGEAMEAIHDKIEINLDDQIRTETRERFRIQVKQLDNLALEMEELMKLVASMHGTQIVAHAKPSWWDRITGRG